MALKSTVFGIGLAWVALVSSAHWMANVRVDAPRAGSATAQRSKPPFRVGFLPVTCHLTCPVTDFINKQLAGDGLFQPVRFSGWPELKEAYLSGHTSATFILAPMAMALREQGVPLKIVHLGHRDGTALVVHTESDIRRVEDLKGKRVAVPNRFSNQFLLIFKALRDRGLGIDDVKLVEMPPPDMPAALASRSVDAITSGEPFMGQAELDGYGRVLYLTKDIWPNFISCVLAVPEDIIRDRRDDVQELVTGIARSGKWLDQTPDHRQQAAQFVATNYYNQDPRLLSFVLSKPPDRVRYTHLEVVRRDFEEIEQLAIAAGIIKGKVHFDDYADPSFVPADVAPYEFEANR
ncbi:MAG TPA: ABC transporter substrate-binding protein [Polyangiaceae bacterium]|nr:ABC transporter substrate-binding protein [Polyangiaceae bacterium]